MSKMEPYRNFKASIDYRPKTSIDLYRLKLLQTIDYRLQTNGNHKTDTYLFRAYGEVGVPSRVGYVCLGIQMSKGTAQRQPHQLIQARRLVSLFFRSKKVSAQPFVMYTSIYLKVISRKCICKQDSRMSRLSMSSRAIESSFS